MKRHPKLTIRVPERISKARAGVDETSIRVWFHNLKENIEELKIRDIFNDPTRVFNIDETCIQLAPKTGPCVTIKEQRNL